MVRGITVCVQYDDILGLVLENNLKSLDELLIVTSPADTRTQELSAKHPRTRLYITDSFYKYGAFFNKGLAMEEGFDALGREGWIMVLDSDIALPAEPINWDFLKPGFLYTPRRHMLYQPSQWQPDLDWRRFHLKEENEWAGYCQVFHADDPKLASRRPWYGINWPHAGGCDSDFQHLWPGHLKLRPTFHVMHLGYDCQNWCGRVAPHLQGAELNDHQQRVQHMERVKHNWDYRLTKLPDVPLPGQNN
jgi:hypothetical protein